MIQNASRLLAALPSVRLCAAVGALVLFSGVISGCDDEAATPKKSAAIADVLGAIGARGTAVNDFQLEGALTTSVTKGGVHFKFAQRAPKLLRLDIVEEKTNIRFDGQTLAIIQEEQKSMVKQSFVGADAASQIITLQNTFGSFACEGWRPPTLSPKSAMATLSQDDQWGPIWTVIQPLQDATLKEVQYKLRAPKADFISKETFNKAGEVVAFTRMTEEHVDEGTGLRFPKRWAVKDAAREYTVDLEKIAINNGIPKEMFAVVAPDGYKVHDAGEGKRQ